jgi:hypothetical protein
MDRDNLSNERIILNNAKWVEKREMTVWQKMANVWNDETFSPLTMPLSPQLTTHFVDRLMKSALTNLLQRLWSFRG